MVARAAASLAAVLKVVADTVGWVAAMAVAMAVPMAVAMAAAVMEAGGKGAVTEEGSKVVARWVAVEVAESTHQMEQVAVGVVATAVV